MITEYLKFMAQTNLMFIRFIDKDLEKEYRKAVWLILDEIEKPIRSAMFINGRAWRTLKQEFLTVSTWPLETDKRR